MSCPPKLTELLHVRTRDTTVIEIDELESVQRLFITRPVAVPVQQNPGCNVEMCVGMGFQIGMGISWEWD